MRNFKINNLPKNCVPVPNRCIVLAPDVTGKSPYHFEFYARNHRYICEWQGVNTPRISYMVSIDVPFHPLNEMFNVHSVNLFGYPLPHDIKEKYLEPYVPFTD